MSTLYSLRCTSHTPPIVSETVGRNYSYEAVRLIARRADVLKLTELAADLEAKVWDLFDTEYANNTVQFIRQHPTCDLELWNEYGKRICIRCGEGEDDASHECPVDAPALNKAGVHEA